MNRKISIITPYYKGEHFIPQLIGVINANFETLKAAFPDAELELIIVNDSPNVAVPEINVCENTSQTSADENTHDGSKTLYPREDQGTHDGSKPVFPCEDQGTHDGSKPLYPYEDQGTHDGSKPLYPYEDQGAPQKGVSCKRELTMNEKPSQLTLQEGVSHKQEHPMNEKSSQLTLKKGISYKLITQPENGGIHKARIAGLKASTGDFIQFLDQDDVLSDNAIKNQLEKIGDYDVIVANAFMEQSDGTRPLLYKNSKVAQKSITPECFVKSHNQIASPGQCLIKKSAIPNEWSEHITKTNGSDDLFLWILMFYSGKKFVINNEALYVHKYTGENLSESEDKMTLSSLEVAGFLSEIDYCPTEMVESFIASRKLTFGDNAQGFNKARSLAKNLDIVAFRAKWKIKGLL